MNKQTSGPPAHQLTAQPGGDLPTFGLTAQFDWRQDRYEHRLLCGAGGDVSVRLVRSLEDDDEAEWPISAPIQQLTTCPLADAREGLVGVGMAGTGHWSVAVEEGEASIVMDVACRLTRLATRLGAAYEVDPRWQGRLATDPSSNDVARVDFESADPSLPHWSLVVDLGTVLLDGNQLSVRPLHLPVDLPATARWRYRFVLRQPA